MSKSYIVILQYLWCNETGGGIEYTSDYIKFDKRDKAIRHGFKLRESDDFNIGVIEAGKLISFDWMDKPVGESEDTLAQIVGIQQMPYGTKLYRHVQQPVVESEPVALQPELAKVIYHFRDWNEGFPVERFKADYVISWMLANYPPAQPAKDREQVRREHAEWSQATFGNVGPVGPLKHLSKEALEAAEQPGDLSEWADMQFLLWDVQRRADITDDQITQAMIEKLVVNKQREWPDPKGGEPRLHINNSSEPTKR